MKTYKERILENLQRRMKWHSDKVAIYVKIIKKYKKNGRVTPEVKKEIGL